MSYEVALFLGAVNGLVGLFLLFQSTRVVLLTWSDRDPWWHTALGGLAMVLGIAIFFYGVWLLNGAGGAS